MERTEAKAVAKTVRISPRKTRLVIDLIRGKSVSEARAILANQPQRASRVISKVLESAIANAVNNFNMKEENLYVKTCFVDEALVIKRIKCKLITFYSSIINYKNYIKLPFFVG